MDQPPFFLFSLLRRSSDLGPGIEVLSLIMSEKSRTNFIYVEQREGKKER